MNWITLQADDAQVAALLPLLRTAGILALTVALTPDGAPCTEAGVLLLGRDPNAAPPAGSALLYLNAGERLTLMAPTGETTNLDPRPPNPRPPAPPESR